MAFENSSIFAIETIETIVEGYYSLNFLCWAYILILHLYCFNFSTLGNKLNTLSKYINTFDNSPNILFNSLNCICSCTCYYT